MLSQIYKSSHHTLVNDKYDTASPEYIKISSIKRSYEKYIKITSSGFTITDDEFDSFIEELLSAREKLKAM